MTSEEAKEALKAGKKVRHKSWRKGQFILEKPCVHDQDDIPYWDFFDGRENEEWEIAE